MLNATPITCGSEPARDGSDAVFQARTIVVWPNGFGATPVS